MSKKITHTDIIVVGAGIAGIASAYYLKKKEPNLDFLYLKP